MEILFTEGYDPQDTFPNACFFSIDKPKFTLLLVYNPSLIHINIYANIVICICASSIL